jgi:hypothetical protein
MPAVYLRVHGSFFHDFSKKIITWKVYEIKSWNLEHTVSNVSASDMCSSLLDAEEHHIEHMRNLISFLIFFRTHNQHFCVGVLSFFVGGIRTSMWFCSFPSNLPGGSFFGGTSCWSRCRCSTQALQLVRCWWWWWFSFWCVYLHLFLLLHCHWSEGTFG